MSIRACLFAGVVGLAAIIPFGQVQAQTTKPSAAADVSDIEREVEDLIGAANPIDDDWSTEAFAERARRRLYDLGTLLKKPRSVWSKEVPSFFEANCRIPPLRPTGGRVRKIGEYEVRRMEPAALSESVLTDVESALESLMTSHGRPRECRFSWKVIGVRDSGPGRFETEVLFQAFSAGPAKRVQQDASLTIDWVTHGDPESPTIRSMVVRSFDEITCRSAPFVDCTRSVIRDEAVWYPQLALGSEYWYGRLDAVGEIVFMGHNGMAVGDVNGDGLDDLYVGMGTGLPNKLFVQLPDGSVRETANEAGVAWLDDTKGVLLLDLDNDGDQDLVCAIGPVLVFCHNDGTGRFTPVRGARAGTPASFYSLTAADFDLDGDLDIYGCRYVKLRYGASVPIPFHDANNGPTNHLLRNDGAAGFTDVTRQVGLGRNNGRFSLAASWADYDGDGDPDLYVANDFGRNNLYRNDGGRFVDVAAEAGAEDQAAGMGVSWSDFDLDGDLDLYVSNMFSAAGRRVAYQSRFMKDAAAEDKRGVQRHALGNTLLVNQGDGTFRDRSDESGVRLGRWAWGGGFIDMNNDGYDDILIPNGFLTNEFKDDL
ncbi:MAG: VCBS repeat-containing protein [Planctomycetota bacterium]|nr:VCBS repeat-containing protein [Planctomycetota bacterium]